MSDLVAAYLFCAGAGAGAAFLVALAELLSRFRALTRRFSLDLPLARRGFARVSVAVYLVALGLVAFGMLCLVFDLGRPDLALKLFFRPTFTLMTLGSYSLGLLALALVGLVATRLLAPRRGNTARGIRGVLCGAVVVLSGVVMVYAGLLLGQMDGAPLYNTPWLAVLFVASALASGLAVVMGSLVVATNRAMGIAWRRAKRAALWLDVAFVVLEAAAAAVYLGSVAAAAGGTAALQPLVQGPQSGLFWGGFAAAGLGLPLGLDALQLRRPMPPWAYGVAVAATLLGAMALRFALVQAGGSYSDALVHWLAAAG